MPLRLAPLAALLLVAPTLHAQERPWGRALWLTPGSVDLSQNRRGLAFEAPVTIEFWLKAQDDHREAGGVVWSVSDGRDLAIPGSQSFEIRYGSNTGGLANELLTIWSSQGDLSDSNAFGVVDGGDPTGEWHHYAVVATGTEYRVYVDGAPRTLFAGSLTGNDQPMGYWAGDPIYVQHVTLGARLPDQSSGWFENAGLDEVRVWNVARTQAQIQRTMSDTLGAAFYASPDSGLVAYWRFDEPPTDRNIGTDDDPDDVADRTANAYHGDLSDAAGVSAFDHAATILSGAPMEFARHSVEWGDYDGDGDLDLLYAGGSDPSRRATIYRNDGRGVFTDLLAALEPVSFGGAAWGDYDGDGDLDLALTGRASSGGAARDTALVYRNDGDGTFSNAGAGLSGGGFRSAAAWGDYDGDGDLDLALVGEESAAPFSTVYRNDGSGGFVDLDLGQRRSYGPPRWGDYDSDGDLDLITLDVHSDSTSMGPVVYRNDGPAGFTTVEDGLGMRVGSLNATPAWGDYDGDGDLDIVVAGGVSTSGPLSLFRNDAGTFTDVWEPWIGGAYSALALGDYDSDGALDLVVIGYHAPNGPGAVYRNTASARNTPPRAPAGLWVEAAGDSAVVLAWDPASDAETPSAGLTYNIRVGNTPGAHDVVSAMALPDGRRLVAALGNVQQVTAWTLRGLEPGRTYHWSVQALDHSYAGSAFAPEQTFTVGGGTAAGPSPGATPFALEAVAPNPFRHAAMLRYALPEAAEVEITVYNVLGQAVARLVDGPAEAGRHETVWDGRTADGALAPSGVYVVRLSAGPHTATRKVVRLR